MKKWIIATFLTMLIATVSVVTYFALNSQIPSNTATIDYTFEMVKSYPHDVSAFTEGLVYDNGFLFESTGLYGNSTLRKVELETGGTLQIHSLPNGFFGEGIALIGDRIIQLTWKSGRGFVYNKTTFEILSEFSYQGEGWGLTCDDNRLIMSNGSATLIFINPDTFQVTGTLWVHDGDVGLANLNELEYVNGDVYANVWHQNRIAIINLQTGEVKGWINLTGLSNASNTDPEDVLNGIAYDADNGRLFVTGKRWPQLFEIKLEPIS